MKDNVKITYPQGVPNDARILVLTLDWVALHFSKPEAVIPVKLEVICDGDQIQVIRYLEAEENATWEEYPLGEFAEANYDLAQLILEAVREYSDYASKWVVTEINLNDHDWDSCLLTIKE